MRKIIILLLSIFLIGSAAGIQNFGPPSGIKVQALEVAGTTTLAGITATGTVQGEQLTSTDDGSITDDLLVGGKIFGGELATVASFKSNATGYFATTLNSGGTATFNALVSNGTADINGALTTVNITLDANKNIVQSGTGTISGGASVSAGDLSATDDLSIGDDSNLADALNVGGTATLNSLVTNGTADINGAMTTENITMTQNRRLVFNTAGTGYIQWLTSSNYMTIKGNPQMDDGFTWAGTASPSSASDLVAIGGASDIDYSLSSGIFKSPTGTNTFLGDIYISGIKTLTMGTGAAQFGGQVTAATAKTNTSFYSAGTINSGGTATLNAATINGTASAEQLTSTDDATITDDLAVGGDMSVTGALSVGGAVISGGKYDAGLTVDDLKANATVYAATTLNSGGTATLNALKVNTTTYSVGALNTDALATVANLKSNATIYATTTLNSGGTATVNAGVINTTLDVNGATTTKAITVDAWSLVTADQYVRRTNTTATNITILDNGADVYLVGNGTGVNTQTILFPTAADNTGRIITVIVATDPLANTVILDGENAETIDGAATKTTTDAVGTMYHLVCNGVGWISAATTGTWS